jgi:hypothetical protein
MENTMFELTEEQSRAVSENGSTPPTVIDPKTQTEYLLIRKAAYELLTDPDFDDSPWTSEERAALAWEAGKHAGWEEMDEYDNLGEKS